MNEDDDKDDTLRLDDVDEYNTLCLDDVDEADPFLLFDEWASPADVKAFDSLMQPE